jgi:pyrroline-5-carboxylate reductase
MARFAASSPSATTSSVGATAAPPLPSWPQVFCPQHLTVPSERTAQVWEPPAAIAVAVTGAPEAGVVAEAVLDEAGHEIARGKDLAALVTPLRRQFASSLNQAASQLTVTGQTAWTFGTIERGFTQQRAGHEVRAYPALVDEGMAAISPGKHCDEAHLAEAESLMASTGRVLRIPEKQQDAVTAISGPGPAYIFYVVESMIEAGVHLGLPRATATELVVQTLIGSGKMLRETGTHPTILREQVTSPGGTTAAALRSLEDHKVRAAFLTGGRITAQEAWRLGGVEKVVPRAELLREAQEFAALIASKSRTALVLAKQALNGLEARDVDHGYRFEQGFTLEMYMHADSQKSRDAFVAGKSTAAF